jgi:hypothetical protein
VLNVPVPFVPEKDNFISFNFVLTILLSIIVVRLVTYICTGVIDLFDLYPGFGTAVIQRN